MSIVSNRVDSLWVPFHVGSLEMQLGKPAATRQRLAEPRSEGSMEKVLLSIYRHKSVVRGDKQRSERQMHEFSRNNKQKTPTRPMCAIDRKEKYGSSLSRLCRESGVSLGPTRELDLAFRLEGKIGTKRQPGECKRDVVLGSFGVPGNNVEIRRAGGTYRRYP